MRRPLIPTCDDALLKHLDECSTDRPTRGNLVMVSPANPIAIDLICSTDEARSMNLTPREVEVLRWVEQGMANADIAVLCDVSIRTVHKHLQHIFDKLNVENRMAAVRRVREHIVERRSGHR